MVNNQDNSISVKETQEMLQASKSKVYRLIRQGKIKATKIGNRYFIPKKSLIEFIDNLVKL